MIVTETGVKGTAYELLAYHTRGIGNNCIACFVCNKCASYSNDPPEEGKYHEGSYPRYYSGGCQRDMAAFVANKEEGERIVDGMFLGIGAWLDYRDYEPNWLQVKIGACSSHEDNLQK